MDLKLFIAMVVVGTLSVFGAFSLVAVVADQGPKDNTDPPHGRSGMRLHADNLTGCQYLSIPGGGITPRLTADGRHMGCGEVRRP